MNPYEKAYKYACGTFKGYINGDLAKAFKEEIKDSLDEYSKLFSVDIDEDFKVRVGVFGAPSLSAEKSGSRRDSEGLDIEVKLGPSGKYEDFRRFLKAILAHEAFHMLLDGSVPIQKGNFSKEGEWLGSDDVVKDLREKTDEIVVAGIVHDYKECYEEPFHSEIAAEFFADSDPYHKISFFESNEFLARQCFGGSVLTSRAPYYVGLALKFLNTKKEVSDWMKEGNFYNNLWKRRYGLSRALKEILKDSAEKSLEVYKEMVGAFKKMNGFAIDEFH